MALTASNNLDASKSSDRLGAVEQALEALRNVIKSNPGMHVVDVLCVLFVCWIGLKITLHDVFMLDFCSQSLEIKAPLRTHILDASDICHDRKSIREVFHKLELVLIVMYITLHSIIFPFTTFI